MDKEIKLLLNRELTFLYATLGKSAIVMVVFFTCLATIVPYIETYVVSILAFWCANVTYSTSEQDKMRAVDMLLPVSINKITAVKYLTPLLLVTATVGALLVVRFVFSFFHTDFFIPPSLSSFIYGIDIGLLITLTSIPINYRFKLATGKVINLIIYMLCFLSGNALMTASAISNSSMDSLMKWSLCLLVVLLIALPFSYGFSLSCIRKYRTEGRVSSAVSGKKQ